MSYSFISQLCESKLFPTKSSLTKHSHKKLARWTYLYLCAMRILLLEDETMKWAKKYAQRTVMENNFDQWRGSGTDLYILLHSFKGMDDDDWSGYGLSHRAVRDWMRAAAQNLNRESEIVRLFMRLDSDLKIDTDELKAIRRLAMNWKKIDRSKKEIALRRLLQRFREEMPRSELLGQLQDVFKEIRDLDESLTENASSGATGAASVATVVGGLGAGFDTSDKAYERSIYPPPPKKKPVVLKR